jgi:hypothetical protein
MEEREDEAREAESGSGEAREAVPAEPSAHEEEEGEDTSGSREIPLGTPVEGGAYRRAKERAKNSSADAERDRADDAQPDPSAGDVDEND